MRPASGYPLTRQKRRQKSGVIELEVVYLGALPLLNDPKPKHPSYPSAAGVVVVEVVLVVDEEVLVDAALVYRLNRQPPPQVWVESPAHWLLQSVSAARYELADGLSAFEQ